MSDIALLAWAVASITLIYPLPLGLEMITGVKYSFGAAIFIKRLHKILLPLSAVEVSCSWRCLSTKFFTSVDKIQSAPHLLLPLSLVLACPSCRALSPVLSKGCLWEHQTYTQEPAWQRCWALNSFSHCSTRKLLSRTQSSEGI